MCWYDKNVWNRSYVMNFMLSTVQCLMSVPAFLHPFSISRTQLRTLFVFLFLYFPLFSFFLFCLRSLIPYFLSRQRWQTKASKRKMKGHIFIIISLFANVFRTLFKFILQIVDNPFELVGKILIFVATIPSPLIAFIIYKFLPPAPALITSPRNYTWRAVITDEETHLHQEMSPFTPSK